MTINSFDQIKNLIPCQFLKPCQFHGVSVDSRNIRKGELFWALPGQTVDGHAFLEEVARKGAAGAVVHKSYQGPDYGLPLLYVPDCLHSLQECARLVLAKLHTKIVAVTGSIGKTTTKEFLKTLLGLKYKVGASPGNFNSQISLPLNILNQMSGLEDLFVLEMGMTHPGDLARLVQIASPEVAVITTVALVHACNFNSLDDIAWAKAEIFSNPKTRLGIIHHDISNLHEISKHNSCNKLTFSSQNSTADYFLDSDLVVHANKENQQIRLQPLNVPGRHNLHNFLAASVVARHFNVPWNDIVDASAHLVLPEKRLQMVHQNGICFVNDSYNASELSVKAALETMPLPSTGGKKIAVLGSMMELGKFSDDCHARVGEHALKYVDHMYCLGVECIPIYEAFKKAGKPCALFIERGALVAHLKDILKSSDVVLLKGSRSKEMWKILEEV